jgi:hypothetical protein
MKSLRSKISTFIILIVILMTWNNQFAFAQESKKADALFIGKISVRFDGYKGRYDYITSNLSVKISQHSSYSDQKIINEFTASSDEGGFILFKLPDSEKFFKILKIQQQKGFTIPSNTMTLTIQKTNLNKLEEKYGVKIYFVTIDCKIDKDGRIEIPMSFNTDKDIILSMLTHAMDQLPLDDPCSELLQQSKQVIDEQDK